MATRRFFENGLGVGNGLEVCELFSRKESKEIRGLGWSPGEKSDLLPKFFPGFANFLTNPEKCSIHKGLQWNCCSGRTGIVCDNVLLVPLPRLEGIETHAGWNGYITFMPWFHCPDLRGLRPHNISFTALTYFLGSTAPT